MCCKIHFIPWQWHKCLQHSLVAGRASRRISIARQNVNESAFLTDWATEKRRDRKASYCLLTVHPDVALFAPHDFHQAVQGAPLAVQAWAVVLDLPSAAQDDFWAQREVFHQHAPIIQHFTLALAAHLSTWAKRRQGDLVFVLSRALLDLRYGHVGRTGATSTLWTTPSVLQQTDVLGIKPVVMVGPSV